ncbi:unnamed protein product [Umbelopsis sp. WA50703]
MMRIYFLKFTSGSISVYYGWRYHCLIDSGVTNCVYDNIVEYPIDLFSSTLFNTTYPQMFANQVSMDSGTQPLFEATPLHNPQIVAAAFLCLICALAATLIVLLRLTTRKVIDRGQGRGFLALCGAALSMMNLALVSMVYDNGEQILNLEFPNIQAETGNGKSLVGITFGLLFVAAGILLRGCLDDNSSEAGYSEL